MGINSRGLWGAVAAAASVVACYGTLAFVDLLSMVGVALTLPEGMWAATIVIASVLAVIATAFNLPRHWQQWPRLTTGLGGALVAYVMFVSYDPIVEVLGFTILIGGIALDLYLICRACLPRKGHMARCSRKNIDNPDLERTPIMIPDTVVPS